GMNARDASEQPGLAIPKQHGQRFVSPSIQQMADWVLRDRQSDVLQHLSFELAGVSLGALRSTARQAAIDLAVQHTSQYRAVTLPAPLGPNPAIAGAKTIENINASKLQEVPIVMGGHQP